MQENWLLDPIEDEFDDAELGDERLQTRLKVLVAALGREPGASFARATKSVAGREAAYRFLENHRVSIDALLEPHAKATAERCREVGAVYVVSDTTEMVFKGEGRGRALGRMQGRARGFLAHVALAVTATGDRAPLGVLGIETIVRSDERKGHRNQRQVDRAVDRESARWGRMAATAEALLDGVAAIHVMDREADMYELLSELTTNGRRFVIRIGRDRNVVDGKLLEAASSSPALLQREVHVSARKRARVSGKSRTRPARRERDAALNVSSKRVTLRRPKRCPAESPELLDVNIVNVFEASPPDGEEAIQWLLVTSEKIETAEDVAAVVDAYRARWLIEEYFKALKSGCAFEDRQLRSVRTLTNALGLLAPIAWRMLLLRTLERVAPSTPADTVIDRTLLDALAAKLREIREPKPLPPNATVADFMRGIARLGGHHKSNGPPGWQLLWYAFQTLLTYGAGYRAGQNAHHSAGLQ